METRKNILQMVEHLLPGGAERMAVNISNVLAANGHYVVLCPTRAKGALEKEVSPKVKLTCLNKGSFIDFIAFIKLYSIVKKHKIEIIHAHSSSVVWACFVKVFIPKIKVIWHDHYGSRISDNKNNFIYRCLSPLINGIITVNEKLKEWSVQNMKLKNIENIIFLNNFPALPDDFKKNKTSTEINILLLSNLREEKDHLNFLKAYASIKNKIIPPTKVSFAGLYWDNDYYNQLIQFIEDENLSEQIEFLGSVNNISELLSKSDIGIICSTFEGLPVSLLEYGSAGLAVIVTDVGQCAEVVDYGKAGLVVPPSSPQLLSEVLLDLINNQKKREVLGINLKKRIEEEYGSKKFLTEYQNLIKRIY